MHQTALHGWHTEHNGRMVDFAGWEMPIQYSTIIEEHHAVRQRAGLFDIAHMGRLRFTGPEACELLDRLLTNDVARLKVGQVRYSLICNEAGGILDDVLVYRFDDSYMLVVNASNREKIVNWIDEQSHGDEVTVTDETLGTFMLALQGPQSVELLSPLVDVRLEGMKYYTAAETVAAGVTATVSRTGYTGEDGFEVIVQAAEGRRVWETLIDGGTDSGLAPCGLGCRDTLRLEAAMPLYGHEMDETRDPLSAGLGIGVKLNAGDFIGRDALVAKCDQPRTEQRVGLMLEGRRIARQGAVVMDDGANVIGTVTSGTYSPTLAQSIAMAYVFTSSAESGEPVNVDIRGQQTPARIVPLPFYSRSSDRDSASSALISS